MPARIGMTLLFVVLAVLAQRWHSWDAGLAMGGSDAESYEAIALAAPAAPPEKLPAHHAQRWPGPLAVGLLAKILGAGVRDVFAWASGACLLGAILLMHAAFARIGVSPGVLPICVAMVVFHYSLRFYLVAPGMLPDALFILGLALTLAGLVGERLPLVVAGILVAGLARQTALLLLPGVAYWMVLGETWVRRSVAARTWAVLAVSVLAVAVYVVTEIVAAPFADAGSNLEAVTSLFAWIKGPAYSTPELAVFVCYAAFPLMVPAAMLVAGSRHAPFACRSGGFVACLLMAAAIVSQPLLGGPDYTQNGNAMRLAALGFTPLALAAAMLLKETGSTWELQGRALPVILLFAAGSLHYNYTLIGPRTPAEFVAVQLAVAVLSAWLLFRRPVQPAPRA